MDNTNKKIGVCIGPNQIPCTSVEYMRMSEAEMYAKSKKVTVGLYDPDTFQVNGEWYTKRETKGSNYGIQSKMGESINQMALMMKGLLFNEPTYVRAINRKVDIVKEYGLITNKNSNMSRWEREEIVKVFNQQYIKVDE